MWNADAASRISRIPLSRARLPVTLPNAIMKNPPDFPTHIRNVSHFLEWKIDALPASCRTVFMLCAVERVSVREASAALSLSVNVVRSRYLRATRLMGASSAHELDRLFAFDGKRCEGIVERVLSRLGDRECEEDRQR